MMDCRERTAGRKQEEKKHRDKSSADCVENSMRKKWNQNSTSGGRSQA